MVFAQPQRSALPARAAVARVRVHAVVSLLNVCIQGNTRQNARPPHCAVRRC